MISNTKEVPSSIFKRITQSLSSHWGSYKVKRNDPLEALLVEAIKGDYRSSPYNSSNIEIQGRNIGQANITRLVPGNKKVNKIFKEPGTEDAKNIMYNINEEIMGAELTGAVASTNEQQCSLGKIIKHTESETPLISNTFTATAKHDMQELSSSSYGLTKDSEQESFQRLNKAAKELEKLENKYSTYGELKEQTLKDKWLEIQSIRMGVNSHWLTKTKIATRILVDNLRLNNGCGDIETVKELLKQGANPFLILKDNKYDADNSSSAPFIAACEAGAAEAFLVMLKHAADKGAYLSTNAVQILNNTMLHPKPFTAGHSKITSILNSLQLGLETSNTVLYTACKNPPEPDLSFVNRCMALGADPLKSMDNSKFGVMSESSAKDILTHSSLGWVCRNGYLNVFNAILETTALLPSEIICLQEVTKDKLRSLPDGHKKLNEYKQIVSTLDGAIKEIMKLPELPERIQKMLFSQVKNDESTLYIIPEINRLPSSKQNLYSISDEASPLEMC